MMLDQLGLAPGQRILEIGAGTGYNAAVMSRLVSPGGHVVGVDIDLGLAEQARVNLARAGAADVRVECGDGAAGFADRGPYDRVIATVGVWVLAPAWLEQLAPGGRLVVPLDLGGVQRSVAFERADGPAAVLAALDGPATVLATEVVARPEQILTDLGLWLAVHEPHWCAVWRRWRRNVCRPLPWPSRTRSSSQACAPRRASRCCPVPRAGCPLVVTARRVNDWPRGWRST